MRTPCDFVWAGVFTVCVCRMSRVEVCVSVRTHVCARTDGRAWLSACGGGRQESSGQRWPCPYGQTRTRPVWGPGFEGRSVNCRCECVPGGHWLGTGHFVFVCAFPFYLRPRRASLLKPPLPLPGLCRLTRAPAPLLLVGLAHPAPLLRAFGLPLARLLRDTFRTAGTC